MQTDSTGGVEFQLRNASADGAGRPAPAIDARLVLYFLLLVPGVFFALLPFSVYPPLDSAFVMRLLLGAYLLPWALFSLRLFRKRPGEGADRLRRAFALSSLALLVLGALLLVNGGLDRSPRTEVRARVIRKTVLWGRRATQYNLAVSSWRPGRKQEDFDVGRSVFDRAFVGSSVTVELHRGFLGLPWHGKISPD